MQVLPVAQQLKVLQFGQLTVAAAGTKVQAAVEVESRLIVGQRVSAASNDPQELVPTLGRSPPRQNRWPRPRWTTATSADQPCLRSKPTADGTATGTTVDAAVEKTGQHRNAADVEKKPASPPPVPASSK